MSNYLLTKILNKEPLTNEEVIQVINNAMDEAIENLNNIMKSKGWTSEQTETYLFKRLLERYQERKST